MNERLAHLKRDDRLDLPVPFVAMHEDGHNFAVIDAGQVIRCAYESVCGICGQPLTYWKAVIGGPGVVQHRMFSDPAMHVECAEASAVLCPHLRIKRHKRRTEDAKKDAYDGIVKPVGFVDDKPDEGFFICITRTIKHSVVRDKKDGLASIIFKAAPWKEVRRIEYEDAR